MRPVTTCQERHINDGPQFSECGLSCRPHPHDEVLILIEHDIRSVTSSECRLLLCVVVHWLHWAIQVVHIIFPRHMALLHQQSTQQSLWLRSRVQLTASMGTDIH